MTRIRRFSLPDLGEGLTEGEILKWLVSPGDKLALNQAFVEVETAKAAVEIPSPYAGVVAELLCDEGQTVDVGTPIMVVDTDPDAGPIDSSPDTEERTPTLVGYGPKEASTRRRPRRSSGDTPMLPTIPDSLTTGAKPVRHGGLEMGRAVERAAALAGPEPEPARTRTRTIAPPPALSGVRPLAKPPVRKLARDLGVDLATVGGTGTDGVITREDVERAVSQAPAGAREERIPIKGVRKLTAEAMVASAFTAPHVTEFLTIDMTRTMRAVQRLRATPEFDGVRVTSLLFVAKAVLLAAARHPQINAYWDDAANEIVVKHYVNLGIAAATPRGLTVPNIKDAGTLSLRGLAEALADLVATAKAGRTAPEDMSGGTITVTNIGVFGIDTGTPILNPGEAAILGFGAIREQPWVHKGKIRIRQVCQLALSFDHRMVDGELGSLFLADIGRFLSDPERTLFAWS